MSWSSDSALRLNRREWVAVGCGLLLTGLVWAGTDRKDAAGFFMIWVIALSLAYARRSPESALCIFAFAQPFEQVFFIYGVGRFNVFSYLAFGLLLIGFFNQHGFRRRLGAEEWAFSAFLFWSLMTIFLAMELWVGLQAFVTYLGGFACLLIFSRGLTDELSARRAVWFYVIGALLLGFYAQLNYEATTFVQRGPEDNYDFIISTLGYGIGMPGPGLARNLSIGVLGALLVWETERSRICRLIALGSALVLGIYTLLAVNRTTIFGLVAVLLIWVLMHGRLSGKAKRLVGALFFSGLVLMVGAVINEGALRQRLVETLYLSDSNAIMSGRSDIWDAAMQVYEDHPWVGVGTGVFPQEVARITGIPYGAHSGYIETLVETGLIGLSIFLALLLLLGWNAWKTGSWRATTIAWWSLFVLSMSVQSLGRGKEYWMTMGIACALAKLQRAQIEGAKQPLKSSPVASGRATRSPLPASS